MFKICNTGHEACFTFDNTVCETARNTRKGRSCRVSPDRRTCKGGDDFFWRHFVPSCGDVPARAEYLMRHHMRRNAQRAVWGLRKGAAMNLVARVALQEAARNIMRKA